MNVDTIKLNEFKRQALRLRQIATELRPFSPASSLRVDSLASDLEIRAYALEKGITP